MSETQDPIRLLRDAPVDSAKLAELRGRVLERLGRRRLWPGRWVLAGASAFALLLGALWLPRTEEPQSPAIAFGAPAPPEWALDPPPARLPAQTAATAPARQIVRAEPVRQAATIVSIENETALLEIPTSNPDVVLYWLVDGAGD